MPPHLIDSFLKLENFIKIEYCLIDSGTNRDKIIWNDVSFATFMDKLVRIGRNFQRKMYS